MTAPAPATGKNKKTRIARFFLKNIAEDSALLPDDKWIVKNLWGAFLETKGLVRESVKSGLLVAGSLACAVAGVALTVASFPIATYMILSLVGGLAGAAFFGQRGYDRLDHLRDKALPEFKSSFRNRYLKLKRDEVLNTWQQRLEEKRRQKAGKKEETPAPAQQPSAETKIPVTKDPETKSLTGSFGKWALNKAIEAATKPKTPKPQKENHGQKPDPKPRPPEN